MSDFQFNFNKLRGKIKEKYNTQKYFSNAVGIGRTTLSERLNSKSYFTNKEIVIICNSLDIPFQEIHLYFFNIPVQKAE